MLAREFKYTDFNGVEQTETVYFNLSKAEIIEMENSVQGGYSEMLTKISEEKDMTKIVPIFKEILAKTYGRKSDDGRRFIKSPELVDDFMASPMYDILFVEVFTDMDALVSFFKGIVSLEDGERFEAAIRDVITKAEQEASVTEPSQAPTPE